MLRTRISLDWIIALGAVAATLFSFVTQLEAADESPRPNLLVILCDDLGYGDLACYGHPHIKTPNLDRLAGQGVRLTACYAAAPVCSSSRAGLLTGRNPNRSGIYDWLPSGIDVHLKTDEPTIPRLLKTAGYQTAMVGKWHLNGRFNSDAQPQPSDYGFDHWMATQNNAAPSHKHPQNFVRNGRPVGKLERFSCQAVADEAIDWLQAADGQQPFYLHVCFHEPHEPVASPPDLVAQYRAVARDEDEAQYFANVANMDAAVGRILEALQKTGNAANTLVVFTSDNGPETLDRYRGANRSYGSPGPLRGMKLHIYEGGIRVPGIVRWPAMLTGGEVSDVPVGGVDLLPTACELAGVDLPKDKPIDGTSLAAMMTGGDFQRSKPLFWWYYRAISPPRFAIRDGDWKLVAHWDAAGRPPGRNINPQSVQQLKTAKLVRFELYNLADDIAEQHDLAANHPDKLDGLKQQALKLFSEVQREAPRWHVGGDLQTP